MKLGRRKPAPFMSGMDQFPQCPVDTCYAAHDEDSSPGTGNNGNGSPPGERASFPSRSTGRRDPDEPVRGLYGMMSWIRSPSSTAHTTGAQMHIRVCLRNVKPVGAVLVHHSGRPRSRAGPTSADALGHVRPHPSVAELPVIFPGAHGARHQHLLRAPLVAR